MSTAVRYLRRGFAELVLVVAIVTGALFIYTRTPGFDALLQAKLEGYLAETYRGKITLESIQAPLFAGITIDRVVVHYRDAEVAKIAKVHAHYSILPLLWGSIHLRVELFRPAIDLSPDPDGRWNLVEALSPKVPAITSATSIHLNSASLREASIEVAPEGPHGPRYRFGNAGVELSAAILPSGTRLSVARLSGQVEAPGFPAAVAEGSLTYQDIAAPASLAITHFELGTQDSKISLAGTLSDFDRMNVNADLRVGKVTAADLARLLPKYKIKHDLSGALTLKGTWQALHAGLTLEAGDARLGAQILADLTARAPSYDAKVKLTNLDARALLGGDYPSGVVDASLTIRGAGSALANASGKASLRARGLGAAGLPLGDAKLEATIENGSARFSGIIENGPSTVTIDGSTQLSVDPHYRMTLTAAHLDLGRIFKQRSTPASDLNLILGFDGGGLDPARMSGALRLRTTNSTLARVAIASGALDAQMANGSVIVSRATLTSQGTVLAIDGALGFAREATAQLSYRIRAASIASWLRLVGLEGDGEIAVSGTVEGPMTDLRAQGILTANNTRIGGASAAHAQVTYDLGRIGQATPFGTVEAAINDILAGIRLRHVDGKLKVAPGVRPEADLVLTAEDNTGGRDTLKADFGWQPQNFAGRLSKVELALPDGTWRLAAPVDFGTTGEAVSLGDFRLYNRDRTFELNGSIAWVGAQDFVLKAHRIDLAAFKSVVPRAVGLGGTLGLEVRVSGIAAAPTVDATLTATALEINAQPAGDLDLKAGYATQRLTIDTALAQDAGHRLTVTGTLPAALQWANGLTARIGGNMDLRVRSTGLRVGPLGVLAPGVVKGVAGRLALDLTLDGPVERPRVNGTIALDGGRAQIVALGVTATDVVTRIRVSPDEVRVVQIAARAGTGSLDGKGVVALANDRPGAIEAELNFNQWPALSTHQYQATVDSRLVVAGTAATPRISGKVEVVHAMLRPDLNFLTATSTVAPDPTIVVIQPGEKLPSLKRAGEPPLTAARERPLSFNQMTVDVRVAVHRDSWIRHQDAEVELEGDLHVIKQPAAAMRIVGAIRTVRGWINFQDRRFDLARGAISFTGGDQIDPALDIDAQHKLTGYVIDVLIGGTANKPSLRLTSLPDLPQADILSLLLFGKTSDALGQGQQAALQQQAANMAAGYAASSIGRTVVESLGLQALGLQMSGISTTGGTIGFGRYLGENTYVSVSQQFGGGKAQASAPTRGVSVEYHILSWLSVKSTSYSDGSREIDLTLSKQY